MHKGKLLSFPFTRIMSSHALCQNFGVIFMKVYHLIPSASCFLPMLTYGKQNAPTGTGIKADWLKVQQSTCFLLSDSWGSATLGFSMSALPPAGEEWLLLLLPHILFKLHHKSNWRDEIIWWLKVHFSSFGTVCFTGLKNNGHIQ